MEYGFASHVVFWIVGLMAVGTTLAAASALWGMGRQGSRKE
jgi:hypothetical protein